MYISILVYKTINIIYIIIMYNKQLIDLFALLTIISFEMNID